MNGKFILGIDLGGTNLKIALLDLSYKIKDKSVFYTKNFKSKNKLILAICQAINNIIESNNLSRKDIIGAGLGLPGLVNQASGIVHFLPNISGWKEVNLKNILQKKTGLTILIDNDAKLMSLAEYRLGNGRHLKNILCITLGTGVGGSIILEGKLYRGQDNAAGEIGHLPINETGPRCNCGGIACLERYIGNKNIIREAKEAFKRNITLEELSALAKIRNKQAVKIWSDVAKRLAIALVGTANLLNLDAVIIGGGVAAAGPVLFNRVVRTVKKQAMAVQAKRIKIIKARLGNEAGLIGAAIMVKESTNPKFKT